MKDEFAPVTPGEMLKQEFLKEYSLSQNQLAKAIGISPNRIAEIVHNRRRITADTALRLGLYFGNSPEFWLNLQTHYDLSGAQESQARSGETDQVAARSLKGTTECATGAVASDPFFMHGAESAFLQLQPPP